MNYKILTALLLVLNTNYFYSFSSNGKKPLLKGYNLSKPDKTIILPPILNEISGITLIDENTAACIQDENGILFIYDLLNNKITKQYKFHIDGDYEGITRINNTIYVLRSDGNLFEIINYNLPGFKMKTHITGIPANNNEGLCYDKENNRLLIASKSTPGKGPEYKDKRVIYGFDLKSDKLDSDPAFIFDITEIKDFAKENNPEVPTRSKKKGSVSEPVIRFRTSAINIHPQTKQLYLLSASDHLLIIFNRQGIPEHIEQLNPEIFNKAEGITFFENGDMLITNEAQQKKPTLLQFNYNSK